VDDGVALQITGSLVDDGLAFQTQMSGFLVDDVGVPSLVLCLFQKL